VRKNKARKDENRKRNKEIWGHSEENEQKRRKWWFDGLVDPERPEIEKRVRRKYAKKAVPGEFTHVTIWRGLWLDKNLNLSEKCLLAMIYSLSHGRDSYEEGCNASNAYFAGMLNRSTDRIDYMMRHLKNEGYLISTPSETKWRKKHIYRWLNISEKKGHLFKNPEPNGDDEN
jgi:hypothetical protein